VITLRATGEGDADAMVEVYRRAVRALGARDYTPEQVEAWVSRGLDAARFRQKIADGRKGWVAVDAEGRVCGFVDLEADGHIDFLYVDPDRAGQGVAGRLLAELEQAARSAGLTGLHVEASETARPVFERHGYTVVRRRDFEIGDVAIHNYAMKRRL
jgi:putative acetyltransferase